LPVPFLPRSYRTLAFQEAGLYCQPENNSSCSVEYHQQILNEIFNWQWLKGKVKDITIPSGDRSCFVANWTHDRIMDRPTTDVWHVHASAKCFCS